LGDRAKVLKHAGGRSLGSSPAAIALTADKLALGTHLASAGIHTPECRVLFPPAELPSDFQYPGVVKPVDGAGSWAPYKVDGAGALPFEASTLPRLLLQRWIPGEALSASLLVGANGRVQLIGVGQQRVEAREGRVVYLGGVIPTSLRL